MGLTLKGRWEGMSGGQNPGEKETISVLNIWIIPHLPLAGVFSRFFFLFDAKIC